MKETEKLKALLVIETGFVVMFFLLKQKFPWLLYTAAAVGVLSLALPVVGDWIVKGWFKIAEILGWINSRILLGVVFYVFLLPISVLARIFKGNPMTVKKAGAGSFYEARDHKYSKDDLENIW